MQGARKCCVITGKTLQQIRNVLLLAFMGSTILTHAQSPAFIRYTQTSGITCNETYDVLQDKLGYIWTATDRGVFRFDGYSFEPFTTAQGLTDNTVFCIEEDYRGRIWLMPFNGELCYIENDTVVEYAFNDTLKKYLPGMRIARTLHVHPSGMMEIGFLLHGIIRISPTGKFSRLTTGDSTMLRHYFARECEDNILMGTHDGKGIGRGYMFSFQLEHSILQTPFVNIPRRHSVSCVKRKKGGWCFAFGNELIEIDAAGNSQIIPLSQLALCLYEDQDNCLWVGMDGGGARRYAPTASAAQEQFEDFFPGEIVTGIIEDTEHSFWIATHHNGLIYVPSIHVRSWKPFPLNKDEPVAFLPSEEGGIYSLWRDYGVARINGDNSMNYFTKTLEKDESFKTMSFNCDHRTLLVGTTITLEEFDPANGTYKELYRMGANSINCGDEGIFVGAAWNLHCLTTSGYDQVIGDSLVRMRPEKLFRDSRDQLWMGALDGLYRVTGTMLESYSSVHPLFARRIAGITQLNDCTLVVATQSSGIVFMKSGLISVLDQSHGFTDKLVIAMSPGSNNSLWVSVEGGLYQVTQELNGFVIKEFPWLSGLLANGGACYFDSETMRFWLANGNEILRIGPDAKTENTKSPPVYIRQVQVQDSTLILDQKAELNHNQNYIRISYSGLAFRLRGNVQYRYRMAGQEEKWNYTRQNAVEFAALEPGDYVFEIQAENENGIWSEVPAQYAFVIHAPYWQTSWFRIAIILGTIMLAYIAIHIRFRIIRKRDLLRESALVFRQQALASQMNPHFVFNALNTIQALVLKDNKKRALEMFSSFASLLRKSLDHSNERYISLAEEVTTLHLYFELEKMRFGESLRYCIEVDNAVLQEIIKVPAMLVQPLVENAIRHGVCSRPEGGNIHVRFRMENKLLLCEVEDDGIGREASALLSRKETRRSGIGITEDRLRVLSQIARSAYQFEITDKKTTETGVANGTLVRFIIPHTLKNNVHEKIKGAVG